MKKYILVGVAFSLALLLGITLLIRNGTPDRDPKLPMGADFVLQSADGPIDSKTLRGKVLLIYFGYTNCPDVCPASLAAGGQVLKTLNTEERSRIKLLMISVDPERDTVQHLKEYTAFFHPEMLGVTGTVEQLATLAKAFGAGYVKQAPKPDGSYAVDHTVSTYVVGPDGKLASVLELGASNEKIVATVRKLF
ncbi:SCO family protein [Dechloromonas denitrificans]|uniref:SCO family protein n=1 Tax=Dechloromonas denitrificans TaxID=281362 RepID=UPI001CF855D1|nr:SCO family protein [Dechloromonas denitrificans]UCV10400.1 SCO family protein [Dechloromonas denitrificans]